MTLNLNKLIMSDEEDKVNMEPPIILISKGVGQTQSALFSESIVNGSDSDSSYGEYAKESVDKMDVLIQEAEMDRIEKTNRIMQARNQKTKELEEKQRGFKGCSQNKNSSHYNNQNSKKNKSINNSKPNSANHITNKNNCKSIKNNYGQKGLSNKEFTKKNTPSSSQITNTKKDVLLPESFVVTNSNNVTDPDLPSKLRNITLQEFDIESTDSSDYESDDSSNKLSENELLKGRLKLFTIKNLNRGAVQMINVDDSMESSDESKDETKDDEKKKSKASLPGRSYWSAEKSYAAHKRKRSNYLKKRNFKNNQNSTLIEQNTSFNEESLKNDSYKNDTSFQNTGINKQPDVTSAGSSTVKQTNKKHNEKNIVKQNDASRIKQFKTTNHQLRSEKVTDNINTQGSKQINRKDNRNAGGIKENVRSNEKDIISSNTPNASLKDTYVSKGNKKNRKNNNKIDGPLKTQKNDEKTKASLREKLKMQEQLDETRSKAIAQRCVIKNKFDISNNLKTLKTIDDSIEILSEVSLIGTKPKNKMSQIKLVENILQDSHSSDGEVGGSLYKCSKSEALKFNNVHSNSDSDDIDFNTLLSERRKMDDKAKESNVTNPIIAKVDGKLFGSKEVENESSSDFEAEFEACLANTKLNFSSNLDK